LLWAVILVLIAAVYTRYDGWILAFLAWIAMAVCLIRRGKLLRINFILASCILLLAPISWMTYNAVVFGDWLDFLRGPYSARAIELRTASSSIEPHPGWHNLWTSLVYFTKAAEMDVAALGWGELIFFAAVIGTIWGWLRYSKTGWAWALFLWLPLPFYAYSVAYGSVPIFIPVWKPFSWYNTRYGVELLPALACFFAFAIQAALLRIRKQNPSWSRALPILLAVLLTANVAEMLREGPLTFVEARKNSESRGYYNLVLAQALARLHDLDPNGEVLMDTSTFPSLVPHAGLTYRQTINESDKEWYWAALAAPASHADIILAFAGDEIDKAVRAHPEHLRVYQSFHPTSKAWDQAEATIYVTDTFPVSPPPQPSTAPTGR
jgi:hypothetical protein